MSKNWEEKACRAWPILMRAAKGKRKMSYMQLGGEIGVHHRSVRLVLSPIQDYCMKERLPPLTILVVNKARGKPGTGFIERGQGIMEVYGHDWKSESNPFEVFVGDSQKDLIKQLNRNPDSAREIYRKVKYRGNRQILFRKALLEIYGNRCAFTGLSFKEGLDACHIVPWEHADEDERMDPRNGILLNSFHHRLFDRGVVTINTDYEIVYLGENSDGRGHTSADKEWVLSLSAMHHLPHKKKLLPLPEYILQRNKFLRPKDE